jgi:hypothetical protein
MDEERDDAEFIGQTSERPEGVPARFTHFRNNLGGGQNAADLRTVT